jgi:hypothetical protein
MEASITVTTNNTIISTATPSRVVLIPWSMIKQGVRCGFHKPYIESWTVTNADGRIEFDTQIDLI